ncbi:MAG TPA: hypothetical protein VEJ44_02255 [Acidimicrobiales bacterium]|nr:hypothetical protein [Acidimicrobiales bacterium]
MKKLVVTGVIVGLVAASIGIGLTVASPVGAISPAAQTYVWGEDGSPTMVSVTGEVGITAGSRDSAAIEPNGSVKNFDLKGSHTKVTTVPNLSDVVAVRSGKKDYLALSSPTAIVLNGSCPDSTVWQWDDGGAATEVSQLNGLGVTEIAEAAGHQFVVTCTGKVYVWGDAELALGKNVSEADPTLNPSLTDLTHGSDAGVQITAGSVTGGILVNGQAYMWGANTADQCGCGSSDKTVESPTAVEQSVKFTVIDSGGQYTDDGQTLAIDTSGQAWCWGANFYGQCGLGTTSDVAVPTAVPGQSSVDQVSAGGDFSLFLDGSEVAECGDIGSDDLTPADVLGGIAEVSGGAFHAVAAS